MTDLGWALMAGAVLAVGFMLVASMWSRPSLGVVIASTMEVTRKQTNPNTRWSQNPRATSVSEPMIRVGTTVRTAPSLRAMAGAIIVEGTVTIWLRKKTRPIIGVDNPRAC